MVCSLNNSEIVCRYRKDSERRRRPCGHGQSWLPLDPDIARALQNNIRFSGLTLGGQPMSRPWNMRCLGRAIRNRYTTKPWPTDYSG
jgi:hypothetical protein